MDPIFFRKWFRTFLHFFRLTVLQIESALLVVVLLIVNFSFFLIQVFFPSCVCPVFLWGFGSNAFCISVTWWNLSSLTWTQLQRVDMRIPLPNWQYYAALEKSLTPWMFLAKRGSNVLFFRKWFRTCLHFFSVDSASNRVCSLCCGAFYPQLSHFLI